MAGILYNRSFSLKIGDSNTGEGVEILPPLRVIFNVKKSVDSAAGVPSAKIKIYNLNKDTRLMIESIRYAKVRLAVGYSGTGGNFEIFSGNVLSAETLRNGPDSITEITASGYFIELHTLVKPATLPANTKIGDILSKVVSGMNGITLTDTSASVFGAVYDGNKFSNAKNPDKALTKAMKSGFSYKGIPLTIFNEIAKDHRMYWYIDSDRVTFMDYGAVQISPKQEVIKLQHSSGLLYSSKTVKNLGDRQGMNVSYEGCSGRALMQPIGPGDLIVVDSSVSGVKDTYQVRNIEYSGDSRGQDWYIEFDAALAKKV